MTALPTEVSKQTQTGPLNNTTTSWNETLNQTQTGPLGIDHIVSLTLVAMLIAIGTVGNTHCLFFYLKRYRKSTQPRNRKNSYTVFVISLAILDLFACVFILPLDIVDMSTHFTPLPEGLCRIFRFLQGVVHMSSVMHICIVSIHCWRQVGFPFSRQLTAKMAIKLCIAADIVAVIPSFPTIPLSGYSTMTKNGQRGLVCKISDKYADTCIPSVYLAVLFTLFLISFIIVSSSYVALIYFRYRKFKTKKRNIEECPTKEGRDQKDQTEETRIRRTTRTLVIIVVIYFMTYTYFLIIGVVNFSIEFAESSHHAVLTVYRILARFPLVNHVINPFVYGWRDEEFRKKVKQFYTCNRKSGTSA